MTEPSEAAKIAAKIFPSMSYTRRWQSTADLMALRKRAEQIIERHFAALREENERLKQQLVEADEFLGELEPMYEEQSRYLRRDRVIKELKDLRKQIATATNQKEPNDD